MHLEKETKKAIEKMFVDRMKAQRIKFETRRFYEEQASFFAGAMSMASQYIQEYVPEADWTMMIMSGRPIVEKY